MAKTPCAGCGAVDESYGMPRWTRKDPLCPDCKEKIAEHDTLVAALKGSKTKQYVVPSGGDIWNWVRKEYSTRGCWYYAGSEAEKELAQPILDLLACFPKVGPRAGRAATPLKRGERTPELFQGGFEPVIRSFPVGFPDAFLEFLKAFNEYSKACAAAGKKKGADLLGGLIDGEVTCAEINDRMVENEG